MNLMKSTSVKLAFGLSLGLAVAPLVGAEHAATTVQLPSKDVDKIFLTGVAPMNRDASVNVVVDAAQAKVKKGGRVVPTARIPRSISGGGPLAAFVLGATPAPGATASGRALTTLCRTAAGKEECRVVVVPRDGRFGPYTTLDQIEAMDPGLVAELKEKFGPAKGEVTFAQKSRKETIKYVGDAISDFELAYVKDGDRRPLDKDGNPQLYKWAGARNIGE
jgi:hypothetical protein